MLLKTTFTLLWLFKLLTADLFLNLKQSSGYISVNNNLENIYYWYIPCTNSTLEAPLVVWFQGGPG